MSLYLTAASPNSGPLPADGNGASQQKLILSRLMRSYHDAINNGQTVASLRPLAERIAETARALGQPVALPNAGAGVSAAAPVAAPPSSKVDFSS